MTELKLIVVGLAIGFAVSFGLEFPTGPGSGEPEPVIQKCEEDWRGNIDEEVLGGGIKYKGPSTSQFPEKDE